MELDLKRPVGNMLCDDCGQVFRLDATRKCPGCGSEFISTIPREAGVVIAKGVER